MQGATEAGFDNEERISGIGSYCANWRRLQPAASAGGLAKNTEIRPLQRLPGTPGECLISNENSPLGACADQLDPVG